MIALALASMLAQAAPAAIAPSPAPAASSAATSTPLSSVTVTAPPPAPDPVAIAENLAQVYDQSCGGRIYGMYAEACNGLAEQLRRAQNEARKAQRKAAAAH